MLLPSRQACSGIIWTGVLSVSHPFRQKNAEWMGAKVVDKGDKSDQALDPGAAGNKHRLEYLF